MSTAQLSDQQVLELGAKLRSARESQGKNLSEAAFRIALSPSQLRALESGDRRPFYSTHYFLQAVDRYADYLDVTLAELAAYRPEAQSRAAMQREDAEHSERVTDSDVSVAANSPILKRSVSAPAAAASIAVGATISQRRHPALAVLAVSAAVVGLSAAVSMKDSITPSIPVAITAEPPPAAATPAQASEPTATASAADASKPAISNAAPASPPSSPAPQAAIAQAASAQAAPRSSAPQSTGTPPMAAIPKRASAINDKDGRIESSANAWVQIVSKSGEKSNLRISAGESIEFASGETAAVVIGQPEKATLTVRGKSVDLRQYASSKDGSSRALVIIGDIRN